MAMATQKKRPPRQVKSASKTVAQKIASPILKKAPTVKSMKAERPAQMHKAGKAVKPTPKKAILKKSTAGSKPSSTSPVKKAKATARPQQKASVAHHASQSRTQSMQHSQNALSQALTPKKGSRKLLPAKRSLQPLKATTFQLKTASVSIQRKQAAFTKAKVLQGAYPLLVNPYATAKPPTDVDVAALVVGKTAANDSGFNPTGTDVVEALETLNTVMQADKPAAFVIRTEQAELSNKTTAQDEASSSC